MRKVLFGIMSAVLITQPAMAAPTKSWGYSPFVITSQKLGKEISDQYIMDNLMCKPTTDNLAVFMELVRDYDLLSTEPRDGMTFTIFAGKQGGNDATVMFAVDSSNQVLSYVWVNAVPNLHCL